jgi:hypothetical protein
MSNYKPITTWSIVRTLREEGLILPRPGSEAFLSEGHDRIEAETAALCAAMVSTHKIPEGLASRFKGAFDAVSTLVSEAHDAVWVDIYGEGLLRQVCEAMFGRNLRMEILRPRNLRRRMLLVGALGTGRPGIGDSIRRLTVECLVRRMNLGNPAADSVSAKLSIGHDAIEGELFGGIRTTKGEQPLGLLSLCQDSVLYVDGVLGIPESLKRRLLDIVDVVDAGHSPRLMAISGGAHLVVGARPSELSARTDEASPLERTLFQALCRDGLIELPQLESLLSDAGEWNRLFPLFYRRVATAYSGSPVQALHHYGTQTIALSSDEVDSDVLKTEQQNFLDWQCAPQRIARVRDIAREAFDGYHWPGNLREFEALMQRLIDVQETGGFDGVAVQEMCSRFRKRGSRGELANDGSGWLARFSDDLEAIPLTENALPNVIAAVEARYYREAAKRAALARRPKPARIQDVARILGVPRQTVARKWQQYNLPASLLSLE